VRRLRQRVFTHISSIPVLLFSLLPRTYLTYADLCADYESGALHPADLKPALAKHLNTILQPVRDHFENNAEAKALLKQVKSFKVTK
jgi:tyrosyl-tRNA synthetase